MTNREILQWQADMRALQKIWHVIVKCEGEISIDGTYDCREAAELHRDAYNKKPSYYGRASISCSSIVTLEMARRRFVEAVESGKQ